MQLPTANRRPPVKIETATPPVTPNTTVIMELESDLFFAEYFLGQATRELGSYTKIAGWSEEICARVDHLYRHIQSLEQEIIWLRGEIDLSQGHDE